MLANSVSFLPGPCYELFYGFWVCNAARIMLMSSIVLFTELYLSSYFVNALA